MSKKDRDKDRDKEKDDEKGRTKGGQSRARKGKDDETAPVLSAPETIVGDGTPDPDYPSYRVSPVKRTRLRDIDPDQTEHYEDKDEVEPLVAEQVKRIGDLQERLYAEGKHSLLIVLQAMDTGGKDGAIRGVFESVNPQGCQVWGFKAPTPEELSHDFLWRIHQKTPGKGMITIFNRSHYEDVLVVRVHNLVPEETWQKRYEAINEWERMLYESGTVIIKFYLHISKEEQKERLEARRDTPEKRWKFSSTDVAERAYWDDYMEAYEEAVNRCSTEHAPWYVVPSNKKWYRNLVISRTIADTLEALNPQFPQPEEGVEEAVIPD